MPSQPASKRVSVPSRRGAPAGERRRGAVGHPLGDTGAAALTKVLVPRRRRGTVERRRLLDALHRHLDKRLHLVVAPAGYGKTTVLVDFAHEATAQGVPVCWLTLDEGDADARSFFEHLLLSLRQRFPEFGARTAALLRGVDDAGREHRALATALCNELLEEADDFFVLILDDFHQVAGSETVNAIVDLLLGLMPDGCRIILAGRTIPSRINLARLAARMDVAGVGTTELRFQPEEAAELIRLQSGLDVHPREAERAVNRAEGWVTAILLSLHVEEQQRFSGLLRARSQSEPIYDYLATQVFDRLPSREQQFLMDSALFPALSAGECDVVLGRTDSDSMLTGLVESGLFIERLGSQDPAPPALPGALATVGASDAQVESFAAESAPEEWYRYHQLWQEFLVKRLVTANPGRHARLRRLASDRELSRGNVAGAVEHLLALRDGSDAAALLELVAERELSTGRAERLWVWLQRLPEQLLDARPVLLLASARALRRLDRIQDSLTLAIRAERQAKLLRQRELGHLAGVWKAQMLAIVGREEDASTALTTVVTQVRRSLSPMQSRAQLFKDACLTAGILGRLQESLAHGERALQDAPSIAELDARRHVCATVHHTMGICHGRLSDSDAALRHYKIAEELRSELGDVCQRARILVAMGTLRRRMGDHDGAQEFFQDALLLSEDIGHESNTVLVLINVARISRELNKLDDALRVIARLEPMLGRSEEAEIVTEGMIEAALTHLRTGHIAIAAQVADVARRAALGRFSSGIGLASALLVVAEGRAGTTSAAVQALRDAEAHLGRTLPAEERIRCGVAVAAAHSSAGSEDGAIQTLRSVRRFARDNGLEQLFFLEAAQYREVATLLLNERRLPKDAVRMLRSALDAEQGAIGEVAGRKNVLTAIPDATDSTRFHIKAFGVPALIKDGIDITSWRTNQVKELVFFLALRAGEAVRTETILDAMSSDHDEDRFLPALWHSVHHARRLFRPLQVIRTVRGGYALELSDAVSCDVLQFRQLIQDSRTPDVPARFALLERAVALYDSPLLGGLDALWIEGPRADLERQFFAAADSLLSFYETTANHVGAVVLCEKVLMIDPVQEEFHLALLRHQLALGERTAARHHFDSYKRIMREEFGREPAMEVSELFERPKAGRRAVNAQFHPDALSEAEPV